MYILLDWTFFLDPNWLFRRAEPARPLQVDDEREAEGEAGHHYEVPPPPQVEAALYAILSLSEIKNMIGWREF